MKELNPRIKCTNGISLSVQANQYTYCSPRIDELPTWNDYDLVEVGFITDDNGEEIAPPESWRQYAGDGFPSDVYGYVPTSMVEKFIEDNGGTR